jgi:hyaluronate lyase
MPFPQGPAAPDGAAAAAERADFVRARAQWRARLTVTPADAAAPAVARRLAEQEDAARAHLAALRPAGHGDGLWPDLPLRRRASYDDSQRVARTARRLRALALAWAAPGGRLSGDPRAAAAVADGLAALAGDVLAPGAPAFGNWYVWQVSAPAAVNDTLVLAGDLVDPAVREALLAGQARTTPDLPAHGTKAAAANRVLLCDSVGGRALLTGDGELTRRITAGLAAVLVYARPQGPPPGLVDGTADEAAFFAHDGFHTDGSFVQHGQFPYAGGYGSSFLSSLAAVAARTRGTRWAVDAAIAAEWARTAFEPWLWRGVVMDTVRGRAIATGADDLAAGTDLLAGLLRLLPVLGADARARLAPLLKGALEAAGDGPPAGLDAADTARALALLGDDAVAARPPSTGTRVFAAMDRVLHRTPRWAVAVAMHSHRMAGYETGTAENLRGWYTADGAAYLYTADREQFGRPFWSTVDGHRIPGTTVDTVPRAAVAVPWRTEYHNPDHWAGGVSAGEWGAAGMRLAAAEPPSTLSARLSWFFFDDAYLHLVSDVEVAVGRHAETVLDNRRVRGAGSGRLLADGTVRAAGPGTREVLRAPRWLHLDGAAGYVPLAGADRVEALRDVRREVAREPGARAEQAAEYVTLTVAHSPGAGGGRCAYAVLPGATAEATRGYAEHPPVRVVDLGTAVHAVRHERTGRFAAAFFGAARSGPVTADGPCAVALRQTASGLTLAVADPTQTRSRLTLRLAAGLVPPTAAGGLAAARDGVRLSPFPGGTRIDIDLGGLRGTSRVLTFGPGSALHC